MPWGFSALAGALAALAFLASSLAAASLPPEALASFLAASAAWASLAASRIPELLSSA